MQGESDDERVCFESERVNELFEETQGSALVDVKNGLFDPSGDPPETASSWPLSPSFKPLGVSCVAGHVLLKTELYGLETRMRG